MQQVDFKRQTTFGIEVENYVRDWPVDHEPTMETRSPIFKNFNGLLIYFRNIVRRHMNDKDFILHSNPDSKSSTISAHIHFKARVRGWNTEYSKEIYDRLFNLINIFQFFFKNSPDKKYLSGRHANSSWCDLEKVDDENWGFNSRHDIALTPNPQGTLEFRFNDVPKSLNQLTMYYYLVYIASKADVEIPNTRIEVINTLEEIDKSKKGLFSYKDIESVKQYKADYKVRMMNFAEHIEKQLNGVKFWNFNNRRYCKFGTFVKSCFKHDYLLFKKFKGNQKAWSDKLKRSFCRKINMELIKDE